MQFLQDLIWSSPYSMLCNTELIDHSSYKILFLPYCCVARKCTEFEHNLIDTAIKCTLVKYLTVCLIKCKIISKSLECFCLESNTALCSLKDLVPACPVVLQLYCKSGLLCSYQINRFQAVSFRILLHYFPQHYCF